MKIVAGTTTKKSVLVETISQWGSQIIKKTSEMYSMLVINTDSNVKAVEELRNMWGVSQVD